MSMFDSIRSFVPKSLAREKKPAEREVGLYPILKAEALLSTDRRQAHLNKFPELMRFNPEDYKNLCLKTIHKFAEFVQSLPETRTGYYSYNGGVLDHGLERASIGVSLARSYHFKDDKKVLDKSDQNALWIYAVFTAALFFDLGKIAVNQIITLCEKNGDEVARWNPLEGSMLNKGATHYKLDFEKENREDLRRRLTSLLAEKLLPAEGYQWIIGDKDVLDAWLAMLNDDKRGRGSLVNLIPIADAKAIEKYYQEIKAQLVGEELAFDLDKEEIKEEEKKPEEEKEAELEAAEEIAEEKEKGLDEEFFEWLTEALESGKITVNLKDSLVQIINEEAALKYPEIINQFINDRNIQGKSVQEIHKAITESDRTKRDFNNSDVHKYQEVKQLGGQQNYLLLSNKNALFKAESGSPFLPDARAPSAELPMIMRVPAAAFYNPNILAQLSGGPSASPTAGGR